MTDQHYTAWSGHRWIGGGALADTLAAARALLDADPQAPLLIFEGEGGKQVDFDLRGSLEEILARLAPPEPKRGPGRPNLGVRSGEVSLLPRHWDWLEAQQGNVSASIRRLVEEAMKREPAAARQKRRIEAIDRRMWALAGDLPGCEEASRALYARDFRRFRALVSAWPGDLPSRLGEEAAEAEGLGST